MPCPLHAKSARGPCGRSLRYTPNDFRMKHNEPGSLNHIWTNFFGITMDQKEWSPRNQDSGSGRGRGAGRTEEKLLNSNRVSAFGFLDLASLRAYADLWKGLPEAARGP